MPLSVDDFGVESAVPAYLGMSLPASGFGGPAFYPDMYPYLNVGLLPDSAGYIQKYFANGKIGYQLPLAEGLGLQAEAMFYSVENRHWDTRSLPVREEGTAVGNTGGSGATLRSLRKGLDLDLNISYRQRPSRFVPGLQYPEFVILAILGKNSLFIN